MYDHHFNGCHSAFYNYHFIHHLFSDETSDINATAAVTVVRSMGRFGTVLVHWRLGDAVNSSTDLSPQTGSLTFNPGVGQMDILITVINDGVSTPAPTRRWTSVVLMLVHHRKQWANIITTLCQCILFSVFVGRFTG